MNPSTGQPQPIFLIDALGAGVSLSFLLLLYRYEELVGMPQKIVLLFCGFASLLALCSASLYLNKPIHWRKYLGLVALGNFSYASLTTYFLIREWEQVTMIGVAYFGGEILILFLLIAYEFRLAVFSKS